MIAQLGRWPRWGEYKIRPYHATATVKAYNETPNHLNVQHYLTWNQVTALAQDGFWLEDHGRKDLTPLWGLTLDQLKPHVQDSAQTLSTHTGQAVQSVAYTGALWPYPAAAQAGAREQVLFANLADLGDVGGVVDARVPSTHETTAQIWQLPRLRVGPGESAAEFATALSQQ